MPQTQLKNIFILSEAVWPTSCKINQHKLAYKYKLFGGEKYNQKREERKKMTQILTYNKTLLVEYTINHKKLTDKWLSPLVIK